MRGGKKIPTERGLKREIEEYSIRLLKRKKAISGVDLILIGKFPISRLVASRILFKMAEKGIIIKYSTGRGYYFVLPQTTQI
jgi:hypothetical protein